MLQKGHKLIFAARKQLDREEEGELLRLAMLDPEILDFIETEWLLHHVGDSKKT